MNDTPLALPTLMGERTRLREWRPEDVAVVQEASGDSLIPLVTTVPRTRGEAEALSFIGRQHDRLKSGAGYAFAIADLEDRAVGHIGLFFAAGARASVGYWIASSHRRRGYARDALVTVTAWAIRLQQLDRVELYIEPGNHGSLRVAAQAGYKREALLRAWMRIDGRPRDMYMYSKLTERALTSSDRS
ncbi:RimJ/RimL family protein N-acetyltransferase [Microbacterium phyllosphaerae]|uniref:RimJ/RimL family protein N-acetyltransferase n=1 Tax=Microbacterium phyllosphaerae TaxID=124798 RepID=A0ABS4WQT0_9MICO|nr:GNAT family protein [Microbacterium phyllosphaerae]MBP2377874.1 RimJ/RimL family protein N-acetyltransferase [Microbacterium phyllosphaerae]